MFPNIQKYSARLGNDKYTITAGDDDFNYIHSKAESLEDTISKSIASFL